MTPPIYKLIYLLYPDIKEHKKDKFVWHLGMNMTINSTNLLIGMKVFETIEYLEKIKNQTHYYYNKPTLTVSIY